MPNLNTKEGLLVPTEQVNIVQLFSGHEAHVEALRQILTEDGPLLAKIQAIGEKDAQGNSDVYADLAMWLDFCDNSGMYTLESDEDWWVEIPADVHADFKKKIQTTVKAHLEKRQNSSQ